MCERQWRIAKSVRNEELVVITKAYDLILWSCKHTGKFPRNHRFVLGEHIERNLYTLLETLIQAKYTRQRQPLLERANLFLEILDGAAPGGVLARKTFATVRSGE